MKDAGVVPFDFHRLPVEAPVNPAGVTERDECEHGNVKEGRPWDTMTKQCVGRLETTCSKHKDHEEKPYECPLYRLTLKGAIFPCPVHALKGFK